MIGVVLMIILLLTAIIYMEIRKYFINRKMRNFEQINGAPIIGVISRIFGTSNYDYIDLVFKFFDEAKTTIFRLWAGPFLVIGVYDPKSVEILLSHESSLNKPFLYDYLHCKTSLIVADKEQWKPHRRALNSVFTVTAQQNSMPYLNEKSRILIKRMQPHLEKAGDLHHLISVCMLDIIMKTMLGIEMHFQSERGERMHEVEKQILNSIQYRIPRIWLRPDFIYDYLSNVGRKERANMKFANDMIVGIYNDKVNALKQQHSTEFDLLQGIDEKCARNFLEKCLQLKSRGIFSRENVLDEMRMIIIAGIDSSALTIFGTLLMLAINQQYQDLVVEELRSIFETADCDVTHAHLTAMNYTERVVKETLRLLTPAPFIARKTTADVELPNGTVPKDTIVIISAMHMHRNPEVWGENVLEFDPDRFLPENVEKRPKFSYIPFSAGPRNCIGIKYSMMSVKIVLAHLLRRYKFTTDLKFGEIKLFIHLMLDIVNDKPLRIEERNF